MRENWKQCRINSSIVFHLVFLAIMFYLLINFSYNFSGMLIVVATMHAEDTTANAVYVKKGDREKGVV